MRIRVSFSLLCVLSGAFNVDAQTLRGSRGVQAQQNIRANREQLTRIKDDEQLERFINELGLLVRLPNNSNVIVDDQLDSRYQYVRPWARNFLLVMGSEHRKAFPGTDPLKVTSAVRTVAYQRSLRRRNSNAAATSGPRRSAHLVGSTVDVTKNGMSAREIEWMRSYLRRFRQQGKGIVIEEFGQPVFHIMIFGPLPKPKPKVTKKK